jgi:anhydro-N-acetylmuramic acid kinase
MNGAPENRLERLMRVAAKPRRTVLGLMSGTSVDGIDAALVEIEGHGAARRERAGEGSPVRLLAFATYSFPPALRARVFRLFDPATARIEEICELDFLLGELFAAAARALLLDHGRAPEDVDLLGTAGQTIWHAPEPVVAELSTSWSGDLLMTRSTLAIGQSAVIAERTGILTVGDLRVRDVAAGGHGAPLVSYLDWVLLGHPTLGRCVQNIGGIGNVTYLPPGADRDDVIAFDTGPGNMVIDGVTEAVTGGRQRFDRDGELAAAGRVRPELLEGWLGDPYFALPPPKTTGRELFGVGFVRRVLADAAGMPAADLVASATALTAESIARSYREFVAPRGPIDEMIVGGGGAKNPTLLAMLRQRLPGTPVVTHEERGLDSRAKEAMAIAVIANDALAGLDTNIRGATGGRPTVLGKINL